MNSTSHDASDPMLEIRSLSTGYGSRQVLSAVNLAVRRGEVLSIIGHNGAGKSTLLKALFGMLPLWEGDVYYEGLRVPSLSPKKWLATGVAFVPQGNRVFPGLTVQENLEVAGIPVRATHGNGSAGIDRVFEFFPVLASRKRQRAETLSGGEKQMLALGFALLNSPRVLLLDEPSLGLAPALVDRSFAELIRLNQDQGVTLLIVEQKVRQVLAIADRACVLRVGKVAFLGPAGDLTDEVRLREVYL